jgi:uncharacterized protein YnzC (UPF0291/DUF896 family)
MIIQKKGKYPLNKMYPNLTETEIAIHLFSVHKRAIKSRVIYRNQNHKRFFKSFNDHEIQSLKNQTISQVIENWRRGIIVANSKKNHPLKILAAYYSRAYSNAITDAFISCASQKRGEELSIGDEYNLSEFSDLEELKDVHFPVDLSLVSGIVPFHKGVLEHLTKEDLKNQTKLCGLYLYSFGLVEKYDGCTQVELCSQLGITMGEFAKQIIRLVEILRLQYLDDYRELVQQKESKTSILDVWSEENKGGRIYAVSEMIKKENVCFSDQTTTVHTCIKENKSKFTVTVSVDRLEEGRWKPLDTYSREIYKRENETINIEIKNKLLSLIQENIEEAKQLVKARKQLFNKYSAHLSSSTEF